MKKKKSLLKRLIVSMLCLVMVFTLTPSEIHAEEDAVLSDVSFKNKSQNGEAYSIVPAFDKDTYTYTLVIDDYAHPASGLYIFPMSSDGSKISVSYTHILGGQLITKDVSSGGKTALMQAFKANSGQGGNVITVTVGTKTYTFNVVREMTLKTLSFGDETGEIVYEFTPAFNKDTTTYYASVSADTDKIKITATALARDAFVTINGGSEAVIDVEWTNHAMSIPVVVSSSTTQGNVERTYNVILQEQPTSFAVTTAPTKTVYQMGESFDAAGMIVSATYENGDVAASLDASQYVITASDVLTDKDSYVTISYGGQDIQLPITVESPFAGKGTSEDPYQLADADDLCILQDLVARGISFEGYHFEMTEHIVLPTDWTGLGKLKDGETHAAEGENIIPFSGTIDGNNHTLIVPENGMPLFSYVRKATVKNLNIYGEKIASYGLVSNYTVDYGSDGDYGEGDEGGSYINGTPDTIDIINVTLKSGSSTLKSGFIGGFASGANVVNIIDCTIEDGVVIGYDKNEAGIGGFAGQFNGTIQNSTCAAVIYGMDRVGGLIGVKGQSMGPCDVIDSIFTGTIVASGQYVGGITGAGYASSSAPNTPCVIIRGCEVTGTIIGKNRVGGILGGEPAVNQCWDNGIGYIQNNTFKGKVTATGEDAYVGAIIGYMNSLNKYNVIDNNVYTKDCGTDKGIGFIKIIDTNYKKPTIEPGVTIINTAESVYKELSASLKNHNRTDDPLSEEGMAVMCKVIKENDTQDKNESGSGAISPDTSDSDSVIPMMMVIIAAGAAATVSMGVLTRAKAGVKKGL